ncbi:DSBA oxidoreductase [Fulvitalea axinellae]|uniref:DSBA oxidoreductase n=2 Tax=Fulvitalea axinellae TaxID=1182444 RepID=A0AAU9CDL9_9BACT|nr:DSBA oxidoreductase [Fulvitalea axinellae]
MKRIKLDIVADVVCPWCYIGKTRLEKAMALAKEEGFEFEISYKPFQLHPEISPEGEDFTKFMTAKFGASRLPQVTVGVAKVAKEDGLEMNFEKVTRMPNTLEAHRLMWMARPEEKEGVLADKLFEAYFKEGQDIGDRNVLLEIAELANLEETTIKGFRDSEWGYTEVYSEESLYRQSGVDAVPSYVINDQHLMQGAQSPQEFLKIFRELAGSPSDEEFYQPSDYDY